MIVDAKPLEKQQQPLEKQETAFMRQALRRFEIGTERERDNVREALEDIEMRIGNQWPDEIRREREAENRPCLHINLLPQFIRQITGDIRQAKPAIKVGAKNENGSKDTADVLAGQIRHIERRSETGNPYFTAVDSQVTCGIGHWRVDTEYADEESFDQELRILPIEDGVRVVWDPDAVLPTREDASWCFVPVDMSRDAFEARWPDKQPSALDGTVATESAVEWFGEDYVRVAEYWVKKPTKRRLALMPDGKTVVLDNLSDEPSVDEYGMPAPSERATAEAMATRVEDRPGFQVCRYIISGVEILEDLGEWPGRYIPIIPVVGEEVRSGRRVYRHGAIRYARDPQRLHNFYASSDAEYIASQPRMPWLGTKTHFEEYVDEWATANQGNKAFLVYTPDPEAPGQKPERVQPPVSSQGMAEGLARTEQNIKATIGIYDAGLGAKSNETSGKAIIARQQEGDVGGYVYVDNFARAVLYTGRVLRDLIPHVYDTERTIRIVGEDDQEKLVRINQVVAVDGMTFEVKHDVTANAYDVDIDTGPSYTTKRQQAAEGMREFFQALPDTGALIADLYAKGQEWPYADKIADRLRVMLPPEIQEMEMEEGGGPGGPMQPPGPPEPDPAMMAEQEAMAAEQDMEAQRLDADLQMKQIDLQMKQIEADLKQREIELKQQEMALKMRELEVRELEIMNPPPPSPAPTAAPAK
jgi:hypothetical protein